MDAEFEAYRRQVESQKEQLLDLLAQIGLLNRYELDIEFDEDSPLAELFVAAKVAADNLGVITEKLEQRATEAEEALRIVKAQRETILELSTPAIQIWDDIIVMPLIGTIDARRARQIIESLLGSVVEHQASVAIVDITGVPSIDTEVADHFIKTIQAARMLGAQVVLTGVSPNNARAMVKLGIDVDRLNAKSSLKKGLAKAFQLTEKQVVDRI